VRLAYEAFYLAIRNFRFLRIHQNSFDSNFAPGWRCNLLFDEKKIRNNLASLAEYCSPEKEEPVFDTLQKAALAAKLCTDPCTVKIESFKIDREFSQKELTDRLLMMKKRHPNTSFI
jgi:hypothetical protein